MTTALFDTPLVVVEAVDGAPPLQTSDVHVSFGGVKAVDGVSIHVDEGEVVGLIGANGAGKTTLMDCISGFVQPRAGSIRAFGVELVDQPAAMRPYLGVGRSFQDAKLFPGLSVEETLLVAAYRHRPAGVLASLFHTRSHRQAEAVTREWVDHLVETMGLVAFREKLVRELSTGTRRVVDIAVLLTQRPRLLLLDEPTAGIAQREAEAFVPLMRRVQAELSCAVLVVEHDMPLVSELCDRVYALETGTVIAEGVARDVLAEPRVIASYLGTDESAILRSGALPRSRRTNGRPRARR